MSDIRISDLIARIYNPVHVDIKREGHTEYWLKGGRGSAKSSFISLEIVQGILRNPGANAIVYRKVAETLRESVYAQMAWAISAMELGPWFRFRLSPMEIIYTPTGQRIMFRGADAPEKSKGIKLTEGYFKYLWFEEVTEFFGMEEIRTIKASIIRGGGRAMTFYSYNPHKSAQNWVNAEVLIPNPERLVHHSDYTQIPAEWLGESFIAEAEALLATNERAYRHTYLGEVTGTGGQVFDNLEIREIENAEREKFDRYQYGGDFGFSSDPCAFMKMHYSKISRTLYITDEIYGVRMTLEMLVGKIKKQFGQVYITCDSADSYRIDELRRAGILALPAEKGPRSPEFGVNWLQDLAKIVVDPKTCPNAAREFSAYEYEQDKNGNFIARCIQKNDHAIDATRYAMETFSKERIAKVRNKSEYGFY